MRPRFVHWIIALALIAAAAGGLRADDRDATVFDHSGDRPWWISAQANFIDQRHAAFHAPYSGPNSLRPAEENALSTVWTLYTGFRFTPSVEILADAESAGGRGLSDALGLAGFSDLDVVRNPTLGPAPYLARLMAHGIIPLTAARERTERNALNGFSSVPTERIEWRIGKLSTVDSFDVNTVGSDSHLQFENWTVDNNGAFDYAADTRGYTLGACGEWHEPAWSLRAGIALMPTVANGIKLDGHIRRARGQNLEIESRRPLIGSRPTVIRVLFYDNIAAMGNYRQSLRIAGNGAPDITATRRDGRSKFGIGLNAEQQVSPRARAFLRAGWNDGRNESFAYTEVDQTIALGGDVGDFFRASNRLGLALVENDLSGAHRAYLAAGGLGFLLGDGSLSYGPEEIIEMYFTTRLTRGVYVSADVQRFAHPGYNRARGPVVVSGVRLHIDL